MTDLISVIIPTFNRGPLLLRAIHSVLNQSYKNFELIVVDDGSTDDTEALLNPFINNQTLKYFKQENSGVAAARNLGAKNSSGAWIAFLDSDDEWLPHKLQQQLLFLKANSHLQIVYSEEIWMRKGVRVNQKQIHKKSGGHIFNECLKQCLIAPSSVMMNRSLYQEMKGFNEEYVVCEDYDLWLRISSLYEIGFIPEPLIIKYGGHDDQLSTKFVAMDMWRLKSMHSILINKSLLEVSRNHLLDRMKEKATILLKGYEKYENAEGIQNVKEILKDILS